MKIMEKRNETKDETGAINRNTNEERRTVARIEHATESAIVLTNEQQLAVAARASVPTNQTDDGPRDGW